MFCYWPGWPLVPDDGTTELATVTGTLAKVTVLFTVTHCDLLPILKKKKKKNLPLTTASRSTAGHANWCHKVLRRDLNPGPLSAGVISECFNDCTTEHRQPSRNLYYLSWHQSPAQPIPSKVWNFTCLLPRSSLSSRLPTFLYLDQGKYSWNTRFSIYIDIHTLIREKK